MAPPTGRLSLLPKEALIKTGPVDHADWNHQPLVGWIQRLRFRLVLSLLPTQRLNRLLEIGYGSGVFMPTLACYCHELYGIDVHTKQREVAQSLQRHQVAASLFSASVERMPFPDAFFDGLIAVSCLEYIKDLETACIEMKRVLKADGSFVFVTPGHSTIVDLGLKILTGESAQDNYGERRQTLIPTLLKHFTLNERRKAPSIGTPIPCLYTAFNLRPALTTPGDGC